MAIEFAEVWLCVCCTHAVVNGDYCDEDHPDGTPEHPRSHKERASIGWLTPWFQDEDGHDPFVMHRRCAYCGSNKGGERFRFGVEVK